MNLIPETGQIITIRGLHFRVLDVEAHTVLHHQSPQHRLSLQALDPENPIQELDVIWELEADPLIHDHPPGPSLRFTKLDPWPRFRALLDAYRWTTTAGLQEPCLLSPLHSSLKVHEYQLVPLFKALKMPQIKLFIADDVGLGKTIEAGLIIQELLARKRIRRILILGPASTQAQWQYELKRHFHLSFDIVDRAFINKLKQRHGSLTNPWLYTSQAISSLDFLKRESHLHNFLDALNPKQNTINNWDLIIVDEAHRLAPARSGSRLNESDRTLMARLLLPHFRHRIFLSATPHNGYSSSFKSLLQLLDPLRFSPDTPLSPKQLQAVMIRRSKDDLKTSHPNLALPKRSIQTIPFQLSKRENALHDALDNYLKTLLAGPHKDLKLLASLLKKRLLSTNKAFKKTFLQHLKLLQPPNQSKQQLLDPTWLDIDHHEQTLFLNLAPTLHSIAPRLKPTIRNCLLALEQLGDQDSKLQALLAWISEHLGTPQDSRLKLLIFTEYTETLSLLASTLEQQGWDQKLLVLSGQTSPSARQDMIEAFSDPNHPASILLATDAASEGLNLQRSCHHLIHFDIPWNPARIEQRNGRIDRYGQPNDLVHCLHFLCLQRNDQRFLQHTLHKIQNARHDLGAINQVLAAQIEKHLLKAAPHARLSLPKALLDQARKDLQSQLTNPSLIIELNKLRPKCRKQWQYNPRNVRQLVNQALQIHHLPPLQRTRDGWRLQRVPQLWRRPKRHEDIQQQLIRFHKHASPNHRLHLSHPLLKRATETFTLHNPQQHLSLERFTALPHPGRFHYLVLFIKTAWFNTLGHRIHEQLGQLWGQLNGQTLRWLKHPRSLPASPGPKPKPPQALLASLRARSSQIDRAIQRALADQRQLSLKQAKTRLASLRTQQLRKLRQALKQRLAETRKHQRLLQLDPDQLLLWPQPLLGELPKESELLELRYSQLARELKHLPSKLHAQLEPHNQQPLRIEHYATLLLFPHKP